MATKASEVIEADVEDERMTCRKGCSKDGVSKDPIFEQVLRSLRRRVNAEIKGLSCMLFPFFPLNPHLLASE